MLFPLVADIKSFASHRSTNHKPAFGNMEVGARSRDHNLESFASELQIENIKATTSSESDKDVMLQKSEDVYYDSQSDFAEEETEEKVKTVLPLMFYTEEQGKFDLKTLYDFGFSWKSFMPLREGLLCHGFREICELEAFGTEFKNAKMADEYGCARVRGLTGFEFQKRIFDWLLNSNIT
jgi:hypothetical protein